MKTRFLLLTTFLSIALVGCSANKDANATVETSATVEIAMEPSTEVSVEPSEESTEESAEESSTESSVEPTTEASEETPTEETPTEEKDADGFVLDDESRQFLLELGATEKQINAVKSPEDFVDLMNLLLYGSSGGSSGGNSGGNSGGSSGGDEDDYDPSMENPLNPDDGSHPGHM